MNLQDYQYLKQQRQAAQIPPRELCFACWRPKNFCYCPKIRPLTLPFHFAILIHTLEEKRPIATGRMAHLCLKNSSLIEGENFSQDPQVNGLLDNPAYDPVVLYPGADSKNLSTMAKNEKDKIFKPGKTPLIFVIDGTWNTARKTMGKSENLRKLPSVCFTPSTPSRIRVRQQPAGHCYTTIEAIYEMTRLLTDSPPDNLLEVLDYMVSLQLKFISEGKRRDEGPRMRITSPLR